MTTTESSSLPTYRFHEGSPPLTPPDAPPERVVVTRAPSDFFSSLAVLGHRWKVVVLGLICTFSLAAMAMVAIPPTYKANASRILLASSQTTAVSSTDPNLTQQKTINPYLAFGGSIKATAEILAKVMNGDDIAQKVQEAGGTGTYVADLSAGDAPIITISAIGKSPAEALTTVTKATDVLEATLEKTQTDAGAKDDLLQTQPCDADQGHQAADQPHPGPDRDDRVGHRATVLFTFLLEALSQHRHGGERGVHRSTPRAAIVHRRRTTRSSRGTSTPSWPRGPVAAPAVTIPIGSRPRRPSRASRASSTISS